MPTSAKPQDRDTGASDPGYAKLKSDTLPWYTEDVEGILTPKARKIFEEYSDIPPDQVIPHIQANRKKLWDTRAYPCTGLYIYLIPWVTKHSAWSTILSHLKSKSDPKVLDVGVYVAHDLRALHFSGVPQSALCGIDLLPFWETGYELYKDEGRFDAKYIIGDILDFEEESEQARAFDGKMDVVWSSAVIHQFPWAQQVLALKRLVKFAKKGSGSLVAGAMVGSPQRSGDARMGELSKGQFKGEEAFRHNVESMTRLWAEVEKEVGVELDVDVKWRTWEDYGADEKRCGFFGEEMGVLEFTVVVT
ncbi:hypothetical protein BDV96DRAFT_567159 [Lophiotrema nucula]|uniref:Methyltransferase domain-containing protein n=1 Tax=Lophiotrema nucula TaxID=690887 RepID=A0A6A5ZLC0_9PLEO|nr:hypothetical protein BDV96DRAFT_567159 [Lophiotrema nucula]